MTTAILVHGGWHSASCGTWSGPRSSEFLAAYWKPEITDAIETFGPERSMFETNYPEDRHLTDFVVLWNTYKRIAADFSPDERSWVFEKAARSIYNI